MIAVRQVTQQNQGKKTAGVDGVKALTPKIRLKLVSQIKVTRKAKAKPTRSGGGPERAYGYQSQEGMKNGH